MLPQPVAQLRRQVASAIPSSPPRASASPPERPAECIVSTPAPAAAPLLEELDLRAHEIIPDDTTVPRDDVHNFPALGIVINTVLKVVICVDCQEGIDPVSIRNHVKQHNKYAKPSATITEDLQERYGVVSLANVAYPSAPISPIFGVPVERQLLYFCGTCHRGYTSSINLRGHQSNGSRCFTPLAERECYRMYGQRLTNGPHKRYFPVDASKLSRRQNNPLLYSNIFETTLRPLPNYSSEPIQGVEDEQNLGSFLFREGWLRIVKDIAPEDIEEAIRLPDEETEVWGRNLQLASHRAMAAVQSLVCDHHGFGLTQLIAQVHSS